MLTLKEYVLKNNHIIVAHRGASGNAPENTIAAYQLALAEGADMIEMDVQITNDGIFVAYHDFALLNMGKDIVDLDYSQIADIDVGSGFDIKYKGEKIPKLEDAIELIQNKCYLILEIKTLAGKNFKENAEKLVQLIEKYNYLDKTLFASFNYSALGQLKNINPNVHLAAIKIPMDNRLPSELKELIGCESLICSVEELNEEIYQDAADSDVILGVYSVDTKSQFIDAIKYKIKALGTDFPAKVKLWLSEINYS